MSDMTDVLAAHVHAVVRPTLRISCFCGEQSPHIMAHIAHQADALTAAGFGPVRESQAAALESTAAAFVDAFDESGKLSGLDVAVILKGSAHDLRVRARAVTVRGGTSE